MVKRRSVALSLFLSVITFGLYFLYWFAKLTRETATVVDEKVYKGGWLYSLANVFTSGVFGTYWFHKVPVKLNKLRLKEGIEPQSVAKSSWVAYLLSFSQFYALILWAAIIGDKDIQAMISFGSDEEIVESIGVILIAGVAAWLVSVVVFSIPVLCVLFCYKDKPRWAYSVSFFFASIVGMSVLQSNLNNYILYLNRKKRGVIKNNVTEEQEEFA